MWCARCNKHLSRCTCADLEERLDKAVEMGALVYKYCTLCGKHYERCKCENPEYVIKGLPTDRPENN